MTDETLHHKAQRPVFASIPLQYFEWVPRNGIDGEEASEYNQMQQEGRCPHKKWEHTPWLAPSENAEGMEMRKRDEKKKQDIIRFVNQYYREFHRTPSTREIAENISLGKSAVYNYLTAMRDEGLIDYDGKVILTDVMSARIKGFNTVGILGSVRCGPLEMEEQEVEEYVDLPASLFGTGNLFILRASGDSMTGAGIDDEDLLVVESREEAKIGDIVVAYVEGEGNTVKRFWTDREKGWIVLHPENPNYEDIVVKDCRIQGVVRKVIKSV